AETASSDGLSACAGPSANRHTPLHVVISSTTAARKRVPRRAGGVNPPVRRNTGGFTPPARHDEGGRGRKLGPDGISALLRASGSREGTVSGAGQGRTDRLGKSMPIHQTDNRGAPNQR